MMCDCDTCFSHLHVHSDASRIDGLGTVHRLIAAAKGLGFKHLGLTDHGTLGNTIAFGQAAKHAGIKPITGMEAYVGRDGKRFHLTLLANGSRGFKTLVELNNLGQRGDDTTRPTFPLEALRTHHDGLIVLTGCPSSPMQELPWSDAREIALELKGFLGKSLMAEVMFISTAHGPWERAAKLARDLGLTPVVTNDAHFPYAADVDAHQVLTQLKASFTYESRLLFLATPNEMIDRVTGIDPSLVPLLRAGMRNAYNLAEKLQVVEFDKTPKLPHVPHANARLARTAIAAMNTYINSHDETWRITNAGDYSMRVEDELNVIKDMDFAAYFLILQDIINYARANAVRVGPGRGSGAGSLVLFLLGCTEIDPIKYGLSFDRFLNRKRKELPDVDTDLEAERRGSVIEYAQKKWGALPIATYSRYSHKSLVHDLARHYNAPRDLNAEAADEGPDSDAMLKIASKFPGFQGTYDAMIGQIRHVGQHAGGVVIVDPSVPVPLERTSHGDPVVAWTEGEYRELSEAGIVKYDLLGLSALSVLRRLEEKLKRHAAPAVDDDPVFELFRSGDLLGIFQFAGSQGILDFTREVAPTKFGDLVAINALYRPGALDSGAAHNYPAWRKAPRLLHPLIDPILAETAGVICYQEQFMAIFATLTDGTMADADLARKVLSKARPGQPDWEAKMADLRGQFFDGGKVKGMSQATVDQIWSEIVTHTRYSFNKSHSVAYAQVAWEMAWWKFYHPADFYAALLSVDRAEWQRYLFEVIARGIEVVPPHVNRSSDDFEAVDGKIYMPLSVIKNLGGAGVAAILKARPFTSGSDFMTRVTKRGVPKRARAGLLAVGAFSDLADIDFKTLDVEPLASLTLAEIQQTYLGLMLPSADLLQRINTAQSGGLVAGVVSFKEVRTSKWGPYNVYRLMPEGAFWSRNHELEIGDEVSVKVKSDNGKAMAVYPL